jgi:Secretion system C-terminal sorting domain
MIPMSRWPGVLITLLILTPFCVLAQRTDTTYFPLGVGNTWTYFQVLDPPNAPPDTLWIGTYSIVETISIQDTLYHVASYPFSLADTLRADGQERIWARIHGKETLLFDFALAEGETYSFQSPSLPGINFQVSVERGGPTEVGAGRFANILTLHFDDPQALDEEHSFTFAPGVGIVYAYGSLGDYEELYSAEVGGQVITAIDEEIARWQESPLALAYPNPFSRSITISVPLNGLARVKAVVYDVLGRVVATLQDRECASSKCEFVWDASRLPGGAYYVRIAQGRHVQTIGVLKQ